MSSFRKDRLEHDLDEEIRSHLDMQIADNIRSGMTKPEAKRAAMRDLGGIDVVKELHREARGFVLVEQTWNDIFYGIRGLAKNPGFTLFAVLTLAIGVGANTTIFNAYNAIALKPIPVADAARVVRPKRWFTSHGLGDRQYGFSFDEYVYCRDHSSGVFSDVVVQNWRGISPSVNLPPNAIASSNASGKLQGQVVSANFFKGLGIVPRLGRTFLPDEDRLPGGNPVLVLSHAFWARVFKSDRQILGQTIQLNGTAFSVIGVAPPEFTGTGLFEVAPDFWAPLSMYEKLAGRNKWDSTERMFQMLARLNGGTSRAQAQAQIDTLIRDYDSMLQDADPTTAVTLQRPVFLGDIDDIRFQALAAAVMLLVSLILLVACANIANMLLARGAVRQREIGVRMALGSSRSRIIRQLLTESCLLSAFGGIAGLTLAMWISRVLGTKLQELAISRDASAIQIDLSLDARVFSYALAVTVIVGIICGLSPALQFSKPDLTAAFKAESSPLTRRLNRSGLRSGLVATQVAVSMFLLITTGLLVRGLIRSHGVDAGFRMQDVFLLSGDFGDRFRDGARNNARQERLAETLRSLPELEGLATGSIPFGTWTPPIVISAGGSSTPARYRTLASHASKPYFDLLGLTLVRGRHLTSQEIETNAHLAIVSEAGARLFWPNEDPLGKHFQLDMNWLGQMEDFEVVGVAKDVRFANLSRIDPSHVYLPANSNAVAGGFPASMNILLRLRNETRALASIRKAAETVDKNLAPTLGLIGLEDVWMKRYRLMTQLPAALAACLACLAFTLAGTGIYGVMGYLVTQQTKDIGIRMSLGATSSNVLKDVIVRGLRPVFAGMILGLIAAAALSGFLHASLLFPGSVDFLYGVPFYDPATFAGLSFLVLGFAALASFVPARRALRIDPMVALRHE